MDKDSLHLHSTIGQTIDVPAALYNSPIEVVVRNLSHNLVWNKEVPFRAGLVSREVLSCLVQTNGLPLFY